MPKWSRNRKRKQAQADLQTREQAPAQRDRDADSPEERYKSYKDVAANWAQLEGDKIKIEEVIGRDVVFKSYMRHARSAYREGKPYVSVQIEQDGVHKYFHTSSASLIDRLERSRESMPYKGKVVKKRSAVSENEYLAIE
jgi:hypothetical protein